jgi:hypothetical protein
MEIYAFGSVCRGEIATGSDIDLLAIVNGHDSRFDSSDYSIYSYERIQELWKEGNPFSWHLFLESKLIYSSSNKDFIKDLGKPSEYSKGLNDCIKFKSIFQEACISLNKSNLSQILDLSTVFLSIRNFATCFSLSHGIPDFSRSSAIRLNGNSIPISQEVYSIFERARILCTRGKGTMLTTEEINMAVSSLNVINDWMNKLLEVKNE